MTGLDDYELHSQIGSGASGTVWRAVRRGPVVQTVAIKRLRAGAATPDNVMRLRREAMVLSELDHPHIVRVLDVLEDGDGVAISMQFAPGGSLEALLARRALLSPGEVVAVAVPIAEALASAHRRAILHVDVKPANILFTSDGEPLLGDFGVARTLGRLTGALGAGSSLAGTAHYLAPELLDGADPDPRCDVYSLAVVCYEALTGKRPFDAALPLAVLRKADTGAHEPLTGRRDIPPAVATVVEEAMARDPNRRIATADLLARALRDAMPSTEIQLPGTVATGGHTEIGSADHPHTSTAPTAAMGSPTATATAPPVPDDRATSPAPSNGPGTSPPHTDGPAIAPTGPDVPATRSPVAAPAAAGGVGIAPPGSEVGTADDDDWEHTRPFGPRPPAYVPPPPPHPSRLARLRTAVGKPFRASGRLLARGGQGIGQVSREAARLPGRLVTAVGGIGGRGPLVLRLVVAAVLVGGVALAYVLANGSDQPDCPQVEEPVVELGAQVVRGDPEGDGCITYGVYQLAAQAVSDEDMLLTIRVEGRRRTIRLGELGDRLLLGDWNCDSTETPGVYRWERGEVHYYNGWHLTGSDANEPDDVEPTITEGRARLIRGRGQGDSSRQSCDRIEVEAIG